MALATAESSSGTLGLITLEEKCAGARSAGNPHAACEVAGAGNGITDDPSRARRGKPRIRTRTILRATAPVLDPTGVVSGEPNPNLHFRNKLHRCQFAKENSGAKLQSNAFCLCYNSHTFKRLI